LPLFRWATGYCQKVIGVRSIGGHNQAGDSGWAHIVDCATGGEGPGMAVYVGWSKDPRARVSWGGGPVTGMIVRDRVHRIRLIAASAPPGLEPSEIPSVEDAVDVPPIQNWIYVFTWFSFALIALLIYGLAVRKRLGETR
jgi:surfeit locus 1 family protein